MGRGSSEGLVVLVGGGVGGAWEALRMVGDGVVLHGHMAGGLGAVGWFWVVPHMVGLGVCCGIT